MGYGKRGKPGLAPAGDILSLLVQRKDAKKAPQYDFVASRRSRRALRPRMSYVLLAFARRL
jgi:hypothetical protein